MLLWTVNFVGLKEICALRKNASNVNVRKFARCNKERRSHLQRQLKRVLEKQNLVFQHISDLCCYLLKLSWGIPYCIHEWQNSTSKRSSYQNWDLHPLLRAFSANVLESSLDNLGIRTSITFKRYLTKGRNKWQLCYWQFFQSLSRDPLI